MGRRKTSTDPDLGTRVYTYDAAGNLESQTNADGTRIQYHYDALNRVYLKEFVPGAPSVQDVPDVTFTYDDPSVPFSKGRLTKLTDGTGETSCSYDILGRAIGVTQRIGNAVFTTATSFDAIGRLQTTTYPDGDVVTYHYDPDGNLASVGDASRTYATLKDFDAMGAFGTLTYGNGVVTTQTYYPGNHRLSHIGVRNAGGSILDLGYQYDLVGNIFGLTDGVDATYSQTFQYDELNRLVRAASVAFRSDASLPPLGLTTHTMPRTYTR